MAFKPFSHSSLQAPYRMPVARLPCYFIGCWFSCIHTFPLLRAPVRFTFFTSALQGSQLPLGSLLSFFSFAAMVCLPMVFSISMFCLLREH